MATQYVVFRTSGEEREWITAELKRGRLRQGWGSQPEADLHEVYAKKKNGKPLSAAQTLAWGNRRMLAETWNGLKPGDVIIAPNLPEYGRWTLLRVTGPYRYEHGEGSTRPNDDYGHILPVESIGGEPTGGKLVSINPRNELVDARLRGTMRTMHRIWGIDRLGDAVEKLVVAAERGDDLTVGQTKSERNDDFLDSIQDVLGEAASAKLETKYRGAEFEHLLVHLFESRYGANSVEHLGGPAEHGADLIVKTTGLFGLEFRIAIQAKQYAGTLGDLHALEQLREAIDYHKVQAAVLLTTADRTSEAFDEAHRVLQAETDVDVQVWTREVFVRLLMHHLESDTAG